MIAQNEKMTIVILMILSFAFFLMPGIIALIKNRFSLHKKSEIGAMLTFSAFLLLAIWFLRYAVGYFSISINDAEKNLTLFEEFFNSFFNTLRTFVLEESYSEWISNLKELFSTIVKDGSILSSFARSSLIIYATILNFLAPIAGGAIIFEILASVFPKIKMGISYLAFWRKKYFFSEVNDASIALAKGIIEVYKQLFNKPIIIFTDAYVDFDNEKRAELLAEAKAIGAICVKDDISHVRKNKLGKKSFLLIDENESTNLQALADLADEQNIQYLKESEIFFVVNSDAYNEIERRIYDELENKFTEEEMPAFVPVNSYRNLITDMLVKIPLFEPLIDKKEKDKLTVTVFGTGQIGVEMFLTTYWIGQILNCTLNINVVSNETEEAFWNKIDYVNPEIRQTTNVNDPILRINKKGDMASPYCHVNYICCDVKSSCFMQNLVESSSTTNILDTDYYFVSVGTDDLNISVANKIKNAVGKHHITKMDGSQAIITYVVYDPTISEVLNRKNMFSYTGKSADIVMKAVGNLNDVYSVRTFYLDDYSMAAKYADEAYLLAQGHNDLAEIHKNRMNDDYKYWANRAKVMHNKYKMFSAGVLYESVFNFDKLNDENYEKSIEEAINRYNKIVTGQVEFRSEEDKQAHFTLLHELSWLEHRRWNAFTRVKGFRHTDKYDVYAKAGENGSYKQMELKLHPCLVECDKKGIRAEIDKQGNPNETFTCQDKSDFDLLDELSYDLYEKKYNNFDFKIYDYPEAIKK